MSSIELLICFALIGTSAFLSGSEIALLSLSRFQLRHIRDHFRGAHRKIRKLLSDTSGLLVSILVSNEVVNISLATIIANALARNWGDTGPWFIHWIPASWVATTPDWLLQTLTGLALTTPVLLIFCEASPKVIAARLNHVIAPIVVTPLYWIYTIYLPVRMALLGLVGFLARRIGLGNRAKAADPASGPTMLREDDFMLMVEEGHKEGLIHPNEVDLIQNVFQLDDTPVSDVCTPISSVLAISAAATADEAAAMIQKSRHFRMPVYDGSRRDIVGILYAKDLIFAKLHETGPKRTARDFMREPYFVPLQMRLNRLFKLFKTERKHMAIVRNEQNVCVGVITMNDVIEALFDDFFPEPQEFTQPKDSRERQARQ